MRIIVGQQSSHVQGCYAGPTRPAERPGDQSTCRPMTGRPCLPAGMLQASLVTRAAHVYSADKLAHHLYLLVYSCNCVHIDLRHFSQFGACHSTIAMNGKLALLFLVLGISYAAANNGKDCKMPDWW